MTELDERIDAQAALCRLSPRAAGPQAVLSRLMLEAGRPAEAVWAAETALALDPRHAAARAARQAAGLALDALEPHVASLELGSMLNADDASILIELAHSYAELGRAQPAERAFKRALNIEPSSAEAHAGLGALYLTAGIDEGAEHHSRKALALEPGQGVASQTLAALLEARGELEAAKAQLDEAYSRQSLFHQPAAEGRLTVLVLATQTSGNIPYRHVMPPRLYSRLIWYMEHARADQVPPPFDLVFNTIGDPDLAQASAAAVDRFLSQCGKPVLNAPDRVAPTRRDRLADLLGGIENLVAPQAARISSAQAADLERAADEVGLTTPLLVRPTGSHGGRGLSRADDAEALRALAGAFGQEDVYLTRYHDYRSNDGLYRKGRMIFVDRRPYPYHWAVSDHWLVHYESAGMGSDPERQTEERRFLQAPESVIGSMALEAIAAVGERLDLDYAGLDFSVLPDGRLLVFEANATMLVHPEPGDSVLAYKNPAVQAIIQAFQNKLTAAAGLPI